MVQTCSDCGSSRTHETRATLNGVPGVRILECSECGIKKCLESETLVIEKVARHG